MPRNEIFDYFHGLITGVMIGVGGMNLIAQNSGRLIPPQDKVQSGYIAPSDIEIKCSDLDRNGEPETIIKINNKLYSLREIEGKPVISAYENRD